VLTEDLPSIGFARAKLLRRARLCQSAAEIACREAGHYQACRQAGEEASPDHGDSRNVNDAQFCDKRIDAQIQHAQSVETSDPAAAATDWAAVDREITDEAPSGTAV
jgi:hypothetical protein